MNNATNKCKFALCSNCYLKRSNKRPAKRQHVTIVRPRNSCNHRTLEVFTQGNYFNPNYIQKNLDKGDIFPTACAQCKRTFTNSDKIVAI